MKNYFLFFFLFIVLNAVSDNEILFTKEKIDEIVKNIQEISKSNYCDKDTLRTKLKIFALNENKTNELYSQLINGCRRRDKELFVNVFYKFFKKEIEESEILHAPEEDDADNGLATYLCKKFMDLIGYDQSECYKKLNY